MTTEIKGAERGKNCLWRDIEDEVDEIYVCEGKEGLEKGIKEGLAEWTDEQLLHSIDEGEKYGLGLNGMTKEEIVNYIKHYRCKFGIPSG